MTFLESFTKELHIQLQCRCFNAEQSKSFFRTPSPSFLWRTVRCQPTTNNVDDEEETMSCNYKCLSGIKSPQIKH